MGTPGSPRSAHLQFQGSVVHCHDFGQDAGAQRGAVVFVKRLVHVLVQEGGFAHAGRREGTRVRVCTAKRGSGGRSQQERGLHTHRLLASAHMGIPSHCRRRSLPQSSYDNYLQIHLLAGIHGRALRDERGSPGCGGATSSQ